MYNVDVLKTLPPFVPKIISSKGEPIYRLSLAGSDYDIGLALGEELAGDMHLRRDWLDHFFTKVCEFPVDRWDKAADTLEKYLQRKFPWMLAEVNGMAIGSGLPLRHLLMANFYSLISSENGNWCTSLAIRESDEGPLLGQNLDIGPEDFYYAGQRDPVDGHATLSYGMLNVCHSASGVNDAGLAVGSSNLPAIARGGDAWDMDGVYFHFLPSLVLRDCANVTEAVEYLRGLAPIIPSSAGYQLNMIDAAGFMAVVDCTGVKRVVRQCQEDLNYTSNCTLDTVFEQWRLGKPNVDGLARAERIQDEWRRLDGGRPTCRWLKELLATDSGDGCLCRWSEVGYSRLSFIFSPVKKTMDIANGPPNRVPYEHFSLQQK